jgi:hypothetical protein
MKMTHKIDEDRFVVALSERGWRYGAAGWVAPAGSVRLKMENDWKEALLAAVVCPHEEAGAE